MQIHIENVSVRFVDSHSSTTSRPAFGIVCAALALTSTNANWEEAVTTPSDASMFKLASANNLGVYFDDTATASMAADAMTTATRDALQLLNKRSPAGSATVHATRHWLLEPCDVRLRITCPLRDHAATDASIAIDATLEKLVSNIEPTHVVAITNVVAHVLAAQRRAHVAVERPDAMTARSRWTFAIRCVLRLVRARRGTLGCTWTEMRAFVAQVGRSPSHRCLLTSRLAKCLLYVMDEGTR
jgi:hypothetical protein